MNSMKQKIFDFTKQNKVIVKIGSHKVQVQVQNLTTALELIARSLLQCKIHNFNSYILCEIVCGIERQIPKNAFIKDYISEWPDKNCYFRVRKNLADLCLMQNIEKTKQLRTKIFEISKQMSSVQSISGEHIYEDVKDSSKIKKLKLNKINKLKLKNTIRKIFQEIKIKKNISYSSDSSTMMFIINEPNFDSTI